MAKTFQDGPDAGRFRTPDRNDRRKKPERSQRGEESGEADRVSANETDHRDQHTAERGADNRAEVAVHRVESERGREVLRRYEPRNHRPRGADPERRKRRCEEREHEARRHMWVRESRVDEESGNRRGGTELRPQKEPSPVERVGSGSADECQREQRHELHERDRSHRKRRLRELVHLVRQRDVRHFAEDV